jgi:hypothetical protein
VESNEISKSLDGKDDWLNAVLMATEKNLKKIGEVMTHGHSSI